MNIDVILKTLKLDSLGDAFSKLFGVSLGDVAGFLIKLAISIIVYVLACKLIDKKNNDLDTSGLLYGTSILRFGFRIFLVLILVNFIGIQSSTITAVFTTITAGIALASQDIVKDFIGGISIMLTRAFAVDDYIILPGISTEGYVASISMFHVILRGRGGRTLTLPCGMVFRTHVTNMTAEGHWLMELVVGITYEDNIQLARKVMLEEAARDPQVMHERPPEVILNDLGESSVNLMLLAWTSKADHFTAYWRLLENIKVALEANGITIAYNQLDVHLGTLEERGMNPVKVNVNTNAEKSIADSTAGRINTNANADTKSLASTSGGGGTA